MNMTTTEKIIKKIESEGVDGIVRIAIENFVDGYNSIVFYDPAEDSFSGETWSSGTYLNPESRLEEVYRLDGNWIAKNSWEINDILSDEEYENLKKAVAKKEGITDEDDIEYAADFMDAKKLELIDISLRERLEEYLVSCEMESQIIGKLKDTL